MSGCPTRLTSSRLADISDQIQIIRCPWVAGGMDKEVSR